MILSDLLIFGKNELERSGCVNASFDALCILENVTGFTRTELFLYYNKESGLEKEQTFRSLIERRCAKEPLQYIIGKWGFMGLDFHVGPGVLIPRPETEGLVEAVVKHIKSRPETVVFDLCAGSGCIGISIANACSSAKVFMIEKSENALRYLKRNLDESLLDNVFAVRGDIFDGFPSFDLPLPDVIVSNPPYIPTEEIVTLQEEVLFEPADALDGGENGLDFYKAFVSLWFPYLKPEGLIVVEVGDNQAELVYNLYSTGYKDKHILYDASKVERIVNVIKS